MSDCVEWAHGRTPKGYGQLWFGGRVWRVHRLVYYLIHDELPEVVRHKCDNPACYNIDHLEGGTQQDNMDDMVARGRSGKKKVQSWWDEVHQRQGKVEKKMEKPERKERPERSEKEIKQRRKPGPPKGSGLYDQHFSMRMGAEHLDILDRVGKGKPRGEVIREMIEMWGKKLAAAGKL